LIFLVVLFIGAIHANIFGSLFSSEIEAGSSGLTYTAKACNPTKHNHTTGAGASYTDVTGDGSLDGYYYACGETVVLFVVISADQTYLGSASVVSLALDTHPALTVTKVVNNCGANGGSSADASSAWCSNAGSVQATWANGQIQFTKLNKGATVVLAIYAKIDCGQLSASGAACTLKSYKIGSGDSCTIDGVSIPFVRGTQCYNCDDGDACTTDIVAGCYTARTCQYIKKNCDDGSTCTVDSCDKTTGKCSNTPISCDDVLDVLLMLVMLRKDVLTQYKIVVMVMLVHLMLVILTRDVYILLLPVMMVMLARVKSVILKLVVLSLLYVVVILTIVLLILVIRLLVAFTNKFLVMMVMSVQMINVVQMSDVPTHILTVMTITNVLKTGVTANKDVFIVM